MKTPSIFRLMKETDRFFNAISILLMQETVMTDKVRTHLEFLLANPKFNTLLRTEIQARLYAEPQKYSLLDIIAFQVVNTAIKYRHLSEEYENARLNGEFYDIQILADTNSHLFNLTGEKLKEPFDNLSEALKEYDIKVTACNFNDETCLRINVKCFLPSE